MGESFLVRRWVIGCLLACSMVACSKDLGDDDDSAAAGSGGGIATGSGGAAMSASGGAGGTTAGSGGTTAGTGGTTAGSGGMSAGTGGSGSGGMTGSGGMSGGTGGATPDGGMADSGMGGGPDDCDACLASMCGAQFTAVMGDAKALTLATCSKGVCTGACCICGVMACSADNWSMGPCGEETLDAAGLPGVAYGLDAVPVTDNCMATAPTSCGRAIALGECSTAMCADKCPAAPACQ
jgi:hypothetical protein